MAGEVLYSETPGMFRNHPVYFIIGLIPIFWPAMLVWWIKCKCIRLTVDETSSVLRTGILSKRIDEVEHRDVRNITVSQTFLQRIFDTGDVGIASAGDANIEIMVHDIPRPDSVRQIINECKSARRREEMGGSDDPPGEGGTATAE